MINGIKLEECKAILYTDEKKVEEKKDAVPPAGGAGYDFWDLIRKADWKGAPEGRPKYTKPSQIWTREQYQRLLVDCKNMADNLRLVLKDMWEHHPHYQEDKQNMFIYHLVGLGKIVCEGVLADTNFAVGLLGDEQDFLGFLSRF